MDRNTFVARYGSIYERSPWVAERAWDGGVDDDGGLAPVFRRVVDRATADEQLALLRAHPDLADRLGVGDLTASSSAEQSGAGLDRCTEAEFAEFQLLNEHYFQRFAFPFIIAVRGLDRKQILAAFRERVEGTPADEFVVALGQVHRIAGLRLDAMALVAEPRHSAINLDVLERMVVAALRNAGADAPNAAAIAATMCAAERDGAATHGIYRLPAMAAALRSGHVNGAATPRMLPGPEGAVIVDGDRGAAAVAYRLALPELAVRARKLGAAVLAVRNTAHFSAMWHEVEWLADEGLAAFACTANFPFVAPFGGSRAFFGTNPIAFAFPRANAALAFDLATSAIARGDLQIAAAGGRRVPENVGLDPDGCPTRDPALILAGAQLPFGGTRDGHKGSAIALLVEMLAAGVVGERFSDELGTTGTEGIPVGGVFVLALEPEMIGGAGAVAAAGRFIDRLEAEPGVRLPGSRRHARRRIEGPIEVEPAALRAVEALAGGSG